MFLKHVILLVEEFPYFVFLFRYFKSAYFSVYSEFYNRLGGIKINLQTCFIHNLHENDLHCINRKKKVL